MSGAVEFGSTDPLWQARETGNIERMKKLLGERSKSGEVKAGTAIVCGDKVVQVSGPGRLEVVPFATWIESVTMRVFC